MQFRRQIDQEIAADDEVELGKGGIHDDVLSGKGHHLANLLADPVAVPFLDKKPLQALGSNVGADVGRIDPGAGLVNGVAVEVGGKDLQGEIRG